MINDTWLEHLTKDFRHDPDYIAELLALEINEQIVDRMEARAIRRSDVARRMDVSRAYVTRLLSGSTNLTLKTLASVCLAVDAIPTIQLQPHLGNLELIKSWQFEHLEEKHRATAKQTESATRSAVAA
ncbi:MAG: helix-turn-helix transcriptional regulator [Dehalococcoidia bacterium]|nr:helix-turn-helix transcriptional regulator [Dehalococcoidia bacterium]